jgi:ketosteroid isomerase-like protein
MRRRSIRSGTLVAALVVAVLGYPAPAAGHATSPDTVDATAVKAAVRAFHDALAAGDSARALALLHPDVRVFEGGHAESLSQYRSGHLAADMEFSAAVERKILDDQVFGGGGRGVYLAEYRTAGTFRGEDVEAHGTETMVLLRTADGWRIRHIHWSSR